jgi:hypothetical protein
VALSSSPARAARPSGKRKPAGKLGWYSDAQKLEAVKTYLITGNHAMTARMLGMHEQTLYFWRREPWWKEIESELRLQDDLQLSERLKKIVSKTFDAVEDRLEHGDWVYDQKTGELRRKHVSMKDAHKVGLDLLNKRHLMMDRIVNGLPSEQQEDKLLKLAEKFAELVTKKNNEARTVDVEDVETKEDQDAVHDEWEEGLQEGEPLVQLEAGTDQSSGRADNSAEAS